MNANTRPTTRAYLAVLALAAALRIAWAVLVPVVPVSDCVVYDGAARRLAQGLPYTIDAASESPSAHWPVGTSFMYSLVYRFFDPQTFGYTPMVVLNLVIGLAVVALSMALASRWFGERVGTITGMAMACWPMHIQFTTVIASEPVFTAFMLAGLLVWPEQGRRQDDDHQRSAFAGLYLAIATYMRPTSLLIPAIQGGIEFLRTGRLKAPVIRAALATAILVALLSPWAIRNYRVFDHVVLVSTNGGTNLWMGNNPETTGYYQQPPPMKEGQNEAEWDKDL